MSAFVPPDEWGLTRQEAQTFCILLNARGSFVSNEALLLALDNGVPRDRDFSIIKVLICKLRRKLAPFHVEIKLLWGRGYFIPDEIRSRLLEAFAPPAEPAPSPFPASLINALTRQEEAICALLFEEPFRMITQTALGEALAASNFSPKPSNIGRALSLLRPKLLRAGYELSTHIGLGWSLRAVQTENLERSL